MIPNKAENFKRVYWYLISMRGIEPEIVSALMNEKKVYQEAKYGNCVFVGYDEADIDVMREVKLKTEFDKEAVDEPNQESDMEEDIEPWTFFISTNLPLWEEPNSKNNGRKPLVFRGRQE